VNAAGRYRVSNPGDLGLRTTASGDCPEDPLILTTNWFLAADKLRCTDIRGIRQLSGYGGDDDEMSLTSSNGGAGASSPTVSAVTGFVCYWYL
jgi:hypothetical protein